MGVLDVVVAEKEFKCPLLVGGMAESRKKRPPCQENQEKKDLSSIFQTRSSSQQGQNTKTGPAGHQKR
jgi:hypothetical protein